MHDNAARRYALESWTVEKKRRGWFIKRTHAADEWRGWCGDQFGSHREHLFFFPWPSDDLHADRQTFWRLTYWNHYGWVS